MEMILKLKQNRLYDARISYLERWDLVKFGQRYTVIRTFIHDPPR